ncbi:ribosomal protein S15 [Gurleya vavrai]
MSTAFDKSRRTFRKFTYRGVDLQDLVEMPLAEFAKLLPSKRRRHILRGLAPREVTLLKKCLAAKEACVNPEDKPAIVRTHARSMTILPQMVGNLVGIYNGHVFVPVEIKPEMIGNVLQDFSATRSSGGHGRPGVGATSSSKFVPLK